MWVQIKMARLEGRGSGKIAMVGGEVTDLILDPERKYMINSPPRDSPILWIPEAPKNILQNFLGFASDEYHLGFSEQIFAMCSM